MPPRVLIVDDNDLMRTLLRSKKYEVIGEAGNGVDALELAERLRPDIICLDILMPEIGGLAALEMIKTRHPQIVVVMVTGNPSVDNVREAIQGVQAVQRRQGTRYGQPGVAVSQETRPPEDP